MKEYKIAIFGLSNLLGKALYEILKEKNYKIKGYSRNKKGWFKDEYEEWEAGKIPEIKEKIIIYLSSISGNWQVIKNPEEAFKVIVKSPFEIMNRLNKNSYFLYTSSASVYPEMERPKKEEDANPENLYGAMKYSAEILLSNLSKVKSIKFCSLRFSRIYGEGMERNPVADFLKGIKNKKVILYDDLESEYDYIYVKDAANAIIFAIENNLEGIYNIGSGKGIKVYEIKKIFEDILKEKFEIEFKDKRKGKDLINIEKIKNKGFKIKYEIEEGIKEIISKEKN
ncbi:MAG: NAD-dependent epimerase/dehydratase family protein [candidate division WOR-3 bacterium]